MPQDAARPVALVLGAAVRSDGRPSAALRRRVGHAVRLWREGRVGTLILSGGGPHRPEAEVMAALCRAAGLPDSALIPETRSASTRDNIRNARTILSGLGNPPVLIVTDGWHMPRAALAARRLGLRAEAAPVPQSPPPRSRLREWRARLWYALTLWH